MWLMQTDDPAINQSDAISDPAFPTADRELCESPGFVQLRLQRLNLFAAEAH